MSSFAFEPSTVADGAAVRGAAPAPLHLALTGTADADVTPAGPPHPEGDPPP